MQLQLHVKSALEDQRGAVVQGKPLEAMIEAGPSTAVEFVVGPGATLKKHDMVLKMDRSKLRLLEASQSPVARLVMGSPEERGYADVGTRGVSADVGRHEGGVSAGFGEGTLEEDLQLTIGQQQLEVISELLDKGTRLRDKMVHSLASGSRLRHKSKCATASY